MALLNAQTKARYEENLQCQPCNFSSVNVSTTDNFCSGYNSALCHVEDHNEHMQSQHTPELPSTSEYCGLVLSSVGNLVNHINCEHEKISPSDSLPSPSFSLSSSPLPTGNQYIPQTDGYDTIIEAGEMTCSKCDQSTNYCEREL